MKSSETIRMALNFGDRGMRALEEMSSNPFTRPGEFGGNHPMWIAGHLAVIEGRLQKILHDTPNPVEHWKPLFDWGTEPSDNPAVYPPFEEVLKTYKSLRAKTMAYLDQVGEEGLDRPTALPPPADFGGAFDTVGKAMLVIAYHQAVHVGQASVPRRASGKSPGFVPSAELRAF
jgi:hypothetical protein